MTNAPKLFTRAEDQRARADLRRQHALERDAGLRPAPRRPGRIRERDEDLVDEPPPGWARSER